MSARTPVSGMALRMLAAVGALYLVMMGSTFFSLGVVLPHMIASLGLSWGQAGFGFTLLALAAGCSSMLPAVIVRRRGARLTLLLGVLTMMLAYATLALADGAAAYYAGTSVLGVGFSLIGAVPALHILANWEARRRALVFGAYLACGGLGGALWPSVAQGVIAGLGGWRPYWWFMAALMGAAGAASLSVIRDRPPAGAEAAGPAEDERGWTLAEALRTPQFYVVGCGIAATYLVASTVNAFTVSYLTIIGAGTALALAVFSVQSVCHAAFPLMMGGLAERVGPKALLVAGLVMQAAGMAALAAGAPPGVLVLFAIGVGGGYGTVFLATTLALESCFGRRDFARIFGANQLFTTISVAGPALVGRLADRTGRFEASFLGCAALLLAAAAGAATLRPPARRGAEPAGLPPALHTELP